MNVSSKPTSSTTSKTSSTSKARSTSSVKKTSTTAKPTRAQAPKDNVSLSKGLNARPNAAVPNFGSWAMSPPAAPQTGAKPVPSDPAPRVAPKPPAPETKVETKAEPQTAAPEAKPATRPEPPAPPNDGGLAKKFDDASWGTAQVRHTAEAVQKVGDATRLKPLSNAGTSALKPLNPGASVLGSAAFGKMAYDSFQKGNYTDAALQGANSLALAATTTPAAIRGGALIAKTAGRAAPALGGALQVYDGFKNGDTWDKVSGGAKLAGAAMVASGIGAPVGGALIVGSYMADLARWGWQAYNGN
ncbi:MAG: hypothetical protein KF760_24455 [Candidatus Eremiobacteraeota bacterium]|nr:hypothetical protein [Candidatus Eremiobacteraeota bacterium]MCW5867532.1 hypothetical protein [Candidatus Eremiobacteraeota bacterium]